MSEFKVIEKTWESAKFKVGIVVIPVELINDKLAVLSDGSGSLSFARFDQFLLDSCVIDPARIYTFLDSIQEDVDNLFAAAEELRNLIIEVNPLLNPELLILTDQNVIKLPDEDDPLENVRRLVDNPGWDKPGFDSGPSDEDIESFISSLPPPNAPGSASWGNGENTVVHHWKELDIVILVMQYSVDDIPEIFRDHTSFDDMEVYKQFVITKCIVDFQNLFVMLDNIGYTKEYGVEKLTDYLYDTCLKYNDFLAWDEIDLTKVKRAVDRKFGKKRTKKNIYKKKTTGCDGCNETEESQDEYVDFEDVSQEEVLSLPERIKQLVIGQDEAIDRICESVWLAKCGLKEEHTPIGVYMLTGSSGCGKTYTAKILAKELYGSEYNMVRINCSEYGQRHEVSKLIGSPSGYVGYDDGNQLVNPIIKNDSTVVLFDEIEKAHSKLHDLLLQICDEGMLTSNKGEVANFKNTVILLTSNIGVKEVENVKKRVGLGDASVLTKQKQSKAIKEAVKSKFKPEFINRLDTIITYNKLTEPVCLKIVELALNTVNLWLGPRNIELKYDDKVIKYLYDAGFEESYGARPLKRAIKKYVTLPLSKVMLREGLDKNATITSRVENDKIVFMSEPKEGPVARTDECCSVGKEDGEKKA